MTLLHVAIKVPYRVYDHGEQRSRSKFNGKDARFVIHLKAQELYNALYTDPNGSN